MAIAWQVSETPIGYERAIAEMEKRVALVKEARADELVWLLEHTPVITTGLRTDPRDIHDRRGIKVVPTGRGGQATWHGPGQRVVYLVLDLRARRRDLSGYVSCLQAWVVAALAELGVRATASQDRIGIWVESPEGREDKIAAIGIRVSRWIASHGLAINLNPDIGEFSRITPCGISEPGLGVTSLARLGVDATMLDLDAALRQTMQHVFASNGFGSVELSEN